MDPCPGNTASTFLKDVQRLSPPHRLGEWEYSEDEGRVFVNTVERSGFVSAAGKAGGKEEEEKEEEVSVIAADSPKCSRANQGFSSPQPQGGGAGRWPVSWRRDPGRLIPPQDPGPEGAAKKMVVQY